MEEENSDDDEERLGGALLGLTGGGGGGSWRGVVDVAVEVTVETLLLDELLPGGLGFRAGKGGGMGPESKEKNKQPLAQMHNNSNMSIKRRYIMFI